jgi:hypothetical protein
MFFTWTLVFLAVLAFIYIFVTAPIIAYARRRGFLTEPWQRITVRVATPVITAFMIGAAFEIADIPRQWEIDAAREAARAARHGRHQASVKECAATWISQVRKTGALASWSHKHGFSPAQAEGILLNMSDIICRDDPQEELRKTLSQAANSQEAYEKRLKECEPLVMTNNKHEKYDELVQKLNYIICTGRAEKKDRLEAARQYR